MRRVLDILLTCNEHITNTITCSHISQCVTTDSVKLSLRPDGTAAYKDPLVRCDQKPCPASQHSTLAQRAAPQTKTAWSRPAQRIGRVLWMSQWTQWGFRGFSYCFDVNGGNGRGGTYMLPRVRPRPDTVTLHSWQLRRRGKGGRRTFHRPHSHHQVTIRLKTVAAAWARCRAGAPTGDGWVSVCGSRLTRPSTEPRSTCHPDSRDSRDREKTTLNQAAPEIFINSVSNIAGKSFTPMHCNICLEVRITSDMRP